MRKVWVAVVLGSVFVPGSVLAGPGTVFPGNAVRWPVEEGGNDHWYVAVMTDPVGSFVLWDDANASAVSAGGYLATITSAAENAFVFDLVDDDPSFWYQDSIYEYGPWLGGHQAAGSPEPDGNWQWVTGEDFSSYTNWAIDQPNDEDALGQDRVHFLGSYGNPGPAWNDARGGSGGIVGYVVEWDGDAIPEPALLSMLGLGAAMGLMRRRKR